MVEDMLSLVVEVNDGVSISELVVVEADFWSNFSQDSVVDSTSVTVSLDGVLVCLESNLETQLIYYKCIQCTI